MTMRRNTTKIWFAVIATLAYIISAEAQVSFRYKGVTMNTNRHCLLVDDTKKAKEKHFLFASVVDALVFADKHNNEDSLWTEIYICPSVYWMDLYSASELLAYSYAVGEYVL